MALDQDSSISLSFGQIKASLRIRSGVVYYLEEEKRKLEAWFKW
jgi:hypothetical protein